MERRSTLAAITCPLVRVSEAALPPPKKKNPAQRVLEKSSENEELYEPSESALSKSPVPVP